MIIMPRFDEKMFVFIQNRSFWLDLAHYSCSPLLVLNLSMAPGTPGLGLGMICSFICGSKKKWVGLGPGWPRQGHAAKCRENWMESAAEGIEFWIYSATKHYMYIAYYIYNTHICIIVWEHIMNSYLRRNHILNMYICKYIANIIHYNMYIYIYVYIYTHIFISVHNIYIYIIIYIYIHILMHYNIFIYTY